MGCDDFLTVTDKSSVSPDNFPSTAEQANLLLTSAYAGSHSIGLYAFYWFPMGVYLYDHTSDTYGSYDERGTSQMNKTDIDSRYITQSYLDIFKWVTFSNTALEGIKGYREKYASDKEKEKHGALDYMEGQALFLRGLAYWHGQIFFEINPDGLGLPLFEKSPDALSEMKAARASVKDTWDFIINDFKKAAQLLDSCKTEPYRADVWSAKGMLAKAYMQAGYPDLAKPVIEDIIKKSGKKLVSSEVYQDMFYGNSTNEFNSENLYEVDMTINMNQNGPWAGYTSGSGMPMVFAPWVMNLEIPFRKGREDKPENDPMLKEYDIVTSVMGGWGNNYIHDSNVRRFGFSGTSAPRRTFNKAYDFDTPKSASNFPYSFAYPNEDYVQKCRDLKADKTRVDPRLTISTGQPLVDLLIDDKGRESCYDKSGEVNNRPELLAFQHRKFTNTHGTETKINYSSGANYPIVRLADIYLLYAEIMKDSDPATALEYVNKVHRRAYGYDPNTSCPYDYKSLTERTKTFDPADHLANDVIKYERWAELFAEGQWWYDVRRWKIGQQEVSYYKETRNGTLTFNGDDYYVQPIPKLELERNTNMVQSGNYPSVR
ncbi:hypothetical protein AGMMS50262_16630 [Bacteroidia bacterium]|nr:hypothetical protein AGMMS50262_16630 [Bacteroidia bacterium]